ncbi:hypothetical protein [uncultured Tateyamaria sp.]|uniref:hypothetical protein n=1 Tax=uncultured Tateyamaria sp. TaxID=455651 RepID=UPI0026341194|nr:hypothetical protein [uncultured Tateyamaria sp.]
MAHVSEQGFVLLLPTGAYITAGVAVVAMTVIALFAMPQAVVTGLFSARALTPRDFGKWPVITSLLSFCVMFFGIYIGIYGSRDPLSNLMPLGFWTIGWIALVSLSAVFGNLWTWINPWTGLYRLLNLKEPPMRLPDRIGLWPATATLVCFAAFLLADPAPDDPTRLAQLVAGYWGVTFVGLILFGPRWCHSAELGHALFASFASLTAIRLQHPAGIGGPGWQIAQAPPRPAAGLFALTLLGVGSFDGLNETFWWLGQIGVNPLEFPGRSAIIGVTLMGLITSILGLMAIFALTIWVGMALAGAKTPFAQAYGWLALCVLPIALVYHVAHYLTAFMVGIQYTIAALSDPFATGADFLGIQPFRVTTGFFNRIDTVRLIWITQAGLVVVGHVWSVLLAHRVAITLFGDHRRAVIATLPLSVFMIGYTFLGLWLLAAPKGA